MRIEIHYAGRATVHHNDGSKTEYLTAEESDGAYLRVLRVNGRVDQVFDPDGNAVTVNSLDKRAFSRQFRTYARKNIAAAMAAAEEEELLAPGVYSAFVLYDDGTWQQPSFSIGRPATEREIEAALTKPKRAFYVAGLQEDSGASKECVIELKL